MHIAVVGGTVDPCCIACWREWQRESEIEGGNGMCART